MKRALLIFALPAIPSVSLAAEFRVTPIRIDLGKDTKSALVNVINDGARANLQVYAMEWEQDAEGKDNYTKTDDIIFFPKVMILDKDETRIIRAGIKMNPPAKEKTYRLFIEEIPSPKKKAGVNVTIAIKFGVPVFVESAKENISGEVANISVSNGTLNALVKNTGSTHFNIESIALSGVSAGGKEIYKKELAGWYLLAGISRTYSAEIPKEVCSNLASVGIKVKTDSISFDSKSNVDKSMCGS